MFKEVGNTIVEYETRISKLEQRIDGLESVVGEVGSKIVEMLDETDPNWAGDQS